MVFLTKEIDSVNPRFSSFSETNKLHHLREVTDISLDFIQMRHSKEETLNSHRFCRHSLVR